MTARKLIVCCDGTWNSRDAGGSPTNVAKMARALLPVDEAGLSQLIYYHPGVGTGDRLDRLLGGAFGFGLSANIQSAYAFLADNFRPGDAIFLFGFSRGAYTVRSLAGVIGLVGLLEKPDMQHFEQIYRIYRSVEHRKALIVDDDEQKMTRAMRALFPEASRDDDARLRGVIDRGRRTQIFFIGVWDTVGSLGIPYGPLRWFNRSAYQFHDTELSERVVHAYQALAIDERRRPFEPTKWTRPAGRGEQPGARKQVLEQVWFAGCHSNVGGGYSDCGLSDTSFLWMASKAAAATASHERVRPLAFDDGYLQSAIMRGMGALVDSAQGRWRLLPNQIRGVLAPPARARRPANEFTKRFCSAPGSPGPGSSSRILIGQRT